MGGPVRPEAELARALVEMVDAAIAQGRAQMEEIRQLAEVIASLEALRELTLKLCGDAPAATADAERAQSKLA